ncbi:MAG: hypothetical protein ACYTDX_04370 [Planctomycetota bacterium]|jgi:hypothetical protein
MVALPRRTLFLVLFAGLLWPAVAKADLLKLIDGEYVEGSVKFDKRKNKYSVKPYKGKKKTYPASEVKYHEKGDLSWDVYKDMTRGMKDLAPEEATAKWLEAARYIKDRLQYCEDIVELEHKAYEKVLKLDKDNDEARRGLGHVQWAGKWFPTEEKRDRYRKTAPKEEMEALGFVKYRKTGLWEKKEDIEAIEAGKKKYQGQWMTEDEIQEAKGYVKDDSGRWVYARDLANAERTTEVAEVLGEKPGTVTSSDHFRFVSWFPVGETAKLKELADKSYTWYRENLGIPLSSGGEGGDVVDLFGGEPVEVFLLISKQRKDKWLDTFGVAMGMDQKALEFYKKGGGWHRRSPTAYFVAAGKKTEKNRERDAEEDFHQAGSSITSMIGRITLEMVRRGRVHPWMGEASGFLVEIRFHETADVNYVSATEYREQVADKAGSRAKYFDFMKTQISNGLDRPFRQIFTMELNRMDWADSMKAWSLLEFLIAKYPDQYRQLMHSPMPNPEWITPEQVQAAIDGEKHKDPSKEDKAKKDEGPAPDDKIRVSGAGAVQVTEKSKEQRAIRCAAVELWLEQLLGKDLDSVTSEWKAWILAKR